MVRHDLDVSQVERLAAVALGEPNHHAATRFLLAALAELDSPVPGLRNVGLLATHELVTGVREMAEWAGAVRRSSPLLGDRGRRLVERLGYSVEPLGINTSMLTIGGRNRAIAVFCDEDEPFDAPAQRFEGASPVSRGLAVADQQNVDWVILTRASEIRIYAARADTGVGRKGRSETFVELNLSLLPGNQAGYLHFLFSADALVDGGTLEKILGNSERFASELATRLRERIYFDTVPALAKAVAGRLSRDPSDEQLDDAYEQVMLILFRLLFVAYAEDKDLLPYSSNNHYHHHYHHHSLKLIARRLLEDRQRGCDSYDERATGLWDEVCGLWDAVDKGNVSWGVPAYNGGLFSDDPGVSQAGAALSGLSLTDAEFAPVLARLLIDETPEGDGPVDFRALSVREFGTIYEGLLESRLAVAQDDLTVRKLRGKDQHVYAPAGRNDPVEVVAGGVYLHNRLGVRKATGSYFTKPFAVEHLLDHALEASLDDHIGRLNQLWEGGDLVGVADAFFDFRCADIAMGSGHFLVAALDRIEARLSAWLSLHPVPPVTAELTRLRNTALQALGELGVGVDIESSSLIRRQVARHCVYGVDRNRVAVELARLAIWVHTFVPGLPLSFLDHNLVCGDSLTGIGTLDEVVAEFEPDADPTIPTLFRTQLDDLLARARSALVRLAHTSDATKREIDEARTAHQDAQAAVAGAKALFDVVTAHRAGVCELPEDYEESTFIRMSDNDRIVNQIRKLNPVHFPAAFPEVFLRDISGFNCLLGNPPWENLKVEKHKWWGRYLPGIRGLSVQKMNRVIKNLQYTRPDLNETYEQNIDDADHMIDLLGRSYTLGRGDPDLYKAFGWRFWNLTSLGGYLGIVLPRTSLSGAGMEKWRRSIQAHGRFADVITLVNHRHWVFEDVATRYTVALLTVNKVGRPGEFVAIRGPYRAMIEYRVGRDTPAPYVSAVEFDSWSSNASFPLVPTEAALRVFRKMRRHPRLDSTRSATSVSHAGPDDVCHQEAGSNPVIPWYFRPFREADSSKDKRKYIGDPGRATSMPSAGDIWPVYRGASFNIWEPDTGLYYDSVDGRKATKHLQAKRFRQHRNRNSPFYPFSIDYINDISTLPCLSPRVAIRRVMTRATDPRTIRAALVPGRVVITDQASYFVRIRGTRKDEAYLVGILSSMILDWYARRIVELNTTFDVLNNFPIPRPSQIEEAIENRVIQLAGRLAAVDDRFDGWAAEVGVPVGSVTDEDIKHDLVCELDAWVAHLYGLDESDLAVIYESFHEGADYSKRHAAVLEHFRRWVGT